jgi:DNA-binding NarL/FixJ family response regulator
MRHGVRCRLEHDATAEVCGEAGSGPDAIRVILREQPDVVVLDQHLPGCDGLVVLRRVRHEGCHSCVVFYSAALERSVIERAFRAGAQGFVGKRSELATLTLAVQAVLAGQRFVDPMLASMLLDPADDELSDREHEVLELLGQGIGNKEIASRLELSDDTVKAHVAAVLRKLGVQSRTEAVALALRTSLIR